MPLEDLEQARQLTTEQLKLISSWNGTWWVDDDGEVFIRKAGAVWKVHKNGNAMGLPSEVKTAPRVLVKGTEYPFIEWLEDFQNDTVDPQDGDDRIVIWWDDMRPAEVRSLVKQAFERGFVEAERRRG